MSDGHTARLQLWPMPYVTSIHDDALTHPTLLCISSFFPPLYVNKSLRCMVQMSTHRRGFDVGAPTPALWYHYTCEICSCFACAHAILQRLALTGDCVRVGGSQKRRSLDSCASLDSAVAP